MDMWFKLLSITMKTISLVRECETSSFLSLLSSKISYANSNLFKFACEQ